MDPYIIPIRNDYAGWLTEDSYIKDITKVSVEEFTNIIEKIADVRAENGAEQARVSQSVMLHQNSLVSLQVLTVESWMWMWVESASSPVTVLPFRQALMVAQANQ